MTPDDAPQTAPAVVAERLIAQTPRAHGMTPEQRDELQQRLEAIIARGRRASVVARPAPSIRK